MEFYGQIYGQLFVILLYFITFVLHLFVFYSVDYH